MSRSNPAEALLAQVERLYARAKSGRWEEVWLSLAGERELAAACSRFVKPSSGWTFLHQAAYAGNELAVRGLIRLGASLSAESKESETARDIAMKRGHAALERFCAKQGQARAICGSPRRNQSSFRAAARGKSAPSGARGGTCASVTVADASSSPRAPGTTSIRSSAFSSDGTGPTICLWGWTGSRCFDAQGTAPSFIGVIHFVPRQ